MINLSPSIVRTKQRGAATLIVALVLLILATLIIIFASGTASVQSKIAANQLRTQQAFQAAEAGMEYGINYLQQNADTVIASPVSGYINYTNASITNVTLANNSKFTIVYTNPNANDYTLIKISSTGVSDDGTASRTISQLVKRSAILVNFGNTTLGSKGNVSVTGNASITNLSTTTNIVSGGTVTLGGSMETNTSAGQVSTAGHPGSDISANNTALANQSINDFIATYLGTSSTSNLSSKFANYYTNSGSTNYSTTLDGKLGTTIWIDQIGGTASFSGNTTIGSPTQLVLLVINGGLSISGNLTFYGFIFVIGSSGITTLTGNNEIHGALISTENLNVSGSSDIYYDQSLLNTLVNQPSLRYYAKIPGSWKDF